MCSNQLSYGAISLTPSGDANYYSGMKTVCQCLLTKKSENLSAKSRRGCLDNLAWGWYTSKVPTYAGVLELADETDSKSVGGDTVWVRPPSPAPIVPKWFLPLRYFLFGRHLFSLSAKLSAIFAYNWPRICPKWQTIGPKIRLEIVKFCFFLPSSAPLGGIFFAHFFVRASA